MISWNNLDQLKAYQALAAKAEKVDLTEEMAGKNGAERVRSCQVPMAAGLKYYYAAKQINPGILAGLKALAEEAVSWAGTWWRTERTSARSIKNSR